MDRVIGHIDLDYFYAQVEEVEDPSLKDRPIIVCVFSGRTEESGVVSTANYKARDLGVHSGVPISVARKKLSGKNPAIIRMDRGKYEVVSARIMERLEEMVDILEPTGIDEAFFDITPSTAGDYATARRVAESIKKSILEGEHLTSSVGIGKSKVVAKLGSDTAKPNGLRLITPEETRGTLAPLMVSRLYGVGPKTNSRLQEMGIRTVGELAKASPQALEDRFGKKFGAYLLASATGTDDDPVVAGLEPTQYSRIITLKKDTRDPAEILSQLGEGIEYVLDRLAASRNSFKTLTAIGILANLSTRTKSKTFEAPVDDAEILRSAVLPLFQELSRLVDKDCRRAGIRVSGLAHAEEQSSLSEFVSP